MINYRKFYENKLKIKLDKDTEIHHIDKNRENNDIKNLVALPKQIHNLYHNTYNKLISIISSGIEKETNFDLNIIVFIDDLILYYKLKYIIAQFIKIKNEAISLGNERFYAMMFKQLKDFLTI